MENSPEVRLTARVLMIDEDDRVLLFRGEDPHKPGIRFWFPPGGGIDTGENASEAAIREVEEETGLKNIVLGPHIWNRRHVFTFYGKEQDCRETWFLARVPRFEIDTSGFTDAEIEIIHEYKWWTQAELSATSDFLTPRDLARLLKDLLTNGLPESPITVDV